MSRGLTSTDESGPQGCDLAPEEGHPRRLSHRLADAYLAQATVRALLQAQLQGALDTSDEFAATVVKNAQAANLSATKLGEYMTPASREAEQVLACVRAAIDSADVLERQVLDKRARSLRDASGTSQRIMEEQEHLEGIGDKARELGMRIRIVAMNTTIEAAHMSGSAGAAVAVLAREIGLLATDVQRLGADLGEAIQTLSDHLNRDVVQSVAQEAHALDDVRKQLAAQVVALNASYAQLDDFRAGVTKNVELATRRVSLYAHNAIGSVQYQDLLRQRLEQINNALTALSNNDEPLLDTLQNGTPLSGDWEPIRSEHLQGDYVMSDQRDTHQRVTYADSKNIELLTPSEQDSQDASGPKIELF